MAAHARDPVAKMSVSTSTDIQQTSGRRPRGRPRAQAAVIDSALALIRQYGVRNVTMEGIAECAGISKVTLYRRWSSRSALLADALFHQLQDTLPIDRAGEPVAVISGHVTRFAAQLKGAIGDLLREIIAEYLANPDMLPDFRERYLALRRKAAVELIARGQAERQFSAPGKPELLHDQLYGALFYRFLFGFGSLEDDDVLQLMHDVLLPVRSR